MRKIIVLEHLSLDGAICEHRIRETDPGADAS